MTDEPSLFSHIRNAPPPPRPDPLQTLIEQTAIQNVCLDNIYDHIRAERLALERIASSNAAQFKLMRELQTRVMIAMGVSTAVAILCLVILIFFR